MRWAMQSLLGLLIALHITWAAAAPAFVLNVVAPDDVQPTLARHLDIQRFANLPDLDANELQRLVADVPTHARSLLGALGYFSPTITTQLDEAQPGNATSNVAQPPTVTVTVDPGAPTTVGSVSLTVRPHPALPDTTTLTQALAQAWALPSGQRFTQNAWDDAKALALTRLTHAQFPAATIVGSLADVDSDARSVALYLEIDPGPPFTFGELAIEGLSRYEATWVQRTARLAGLAPGQPYNLSTLQAAQQRLAQTGYFDSVFVYVDPTGPAELSPVIVKVREARRGKLVLGVGGSTDNGARFSLEHTAHRLPGIDWRAFTQLKLARDARTAQTELTSPVSGGGWRWMAGAKAEHLTDTTSTTRNQQLTFGRSHDTEQLSRRYTLQLDQSLTQPLSLYGTAPQQADQAISLHHSWHRRSYDQLPFPTHGHGLTVEVGAGTTLQPTRAPYARTHVRWQALHTLANRSAGRIAYRLEGGAVWAAADTPVPDAQLFLTGGDQTVRGYRLRSIGVTGADGSVSAGRFLATGSIEWQRPWSTNGAPSPWETTVFIDGGAVADRMKDLKGRWGIGAGVRYNTPVGPLQADLAWGMHTRKVRLHISVGFVF
jgi:translocation and assembly module TamA